MEEARRSSSALLRVPASDSKTSKITPRATIALLTREGRMEQQPVASQAARSGLTRALCALVVVLMVVAVLYAATMAIRYFGQISV